LPRWNFSSDFLHHVAGHLMVLPVVGSSWSDWGTPQAIARTFAAERRLPPSSLLQLGLAAAT